ncbi:MAG: PEP-utilizing enzyme [Defluviitaleaceae bacterium]|nr:PEP-utilizing enzyme [Defluviitaleaceae bacterium]
MALARLQSLDCKIPPWFAVNEVTSDKLVKEITVALSEFDEKTLFAVRSSSHLEDGVLHSFAGQFETYLNVPKSEIIEKIALVRQSHLNERVQTYLEENYLNETLPPAVLVQQMIPAEIAGVAFSANPLTGNTKECVISAVAGLGNQLVDGQVDGENFIVIGKTVQGSGILTETQCLEIAQLCRLVSCFFGRLQDIEWAYEKGQLYLLQSRPITSLKMFSAKTGYLNIWDNSNIAESYNGVTTPLTFSFIRTAYEHVYREMARIMGVKESKIQENDFIFTHMLGLHDGQVYYNLLSWYKLVAILPGYKTNSTFMEQMMGVKEGLSDEVRKLLPPPSDASIWTAILKLAKHHLRNTKNVVHFHQLLNKTLYKKDLNDLSLFELAEYYRELENKLLKKWNAPVVNDFFSSIFYGLLKITSTKWGKVTDEHQFNGLLTHSGDIISTEPARLIKEIAIDIKDNEQLVHAFLELPIVKINSQLDANIKSKIDFYLDKFGNRCINELKLESETLNDDAITLYRAIGALAERLKKDKDLTGLKVSIQSPVVNIKGVKGLIYRWILKNTRKTIVNRENLRFERTRVFGTVRQIFREIGAKLTSFKVIDDRDDVFYLEYGEVLGFIEGTATTLDLRGLVAVRKAEYKRYGSFEENRFETYDGVGLSKRHLKVSNTEITDDMLIGLGCCPGVVRGYAKVVTNPKGATLNSGEILVAKRTDPGWIMLFPPAAGVLVEYGSLLSHTAIVVREMGIPAVVSVKQLTNTITTGDLIELDGEKGIVKIIEKASKN